MGKIGIIRGTEVTESVGTIGCHREDGLHAILRSDDIGATEKSFPLFRCPSCCLSGYIDDDQFHGRVSVECPNEACSYHETKDWSVKEGVKGKA